MTELRSAYSQPITEAVRCPWHDREPHVWRGQGLKALGIAALCIGFGFAAVMFFVVMGAK